MKHYDDIDYDQFLYPHRNPDFQPDIAAVSKVIADHRSWRNPQQYHRRMAK